MSPTSEHTVDSMTAAEALQALSWLVDMGADEAIAENPINHFAAPQTPSTQTTARATTQATIPAATTSGTLQQQSQQGAPNAASKLPSSPAAPAALASHVSGTIELAQQQAAAATSLDALADAISSFDGFARRATCKMPVIGSGPADAKLMVITKAPTAPQEDQSGRLFSGDIAPLVAAMFKAINHPLETAIRTATLVPWRESGGRDHRPETYQLYASFLRRHIELVQPKAILCFGAGPAATLLGQDPASISKFRGKVHKAAIGDKTIDLITTHHPDSLIRQPMMKAMVWQDLLSLKAQLEQP